MKLKTPMVIEIKIETSTDGWKLYQSSQCEKIGVEIGEMIERMIPVAIKKGSCELSIYDYLAEKTGTIKMYPKEAGYDHR